jgi:aminoglycoside/choline kinase family phosphotransferase
MIFPPGTWTPVAADASTRRYYRGEWEGQPALLADFGEDLDGLSRFLHVQRLFRAHGIPVPRIEAEGLAPSLLVQEWVHGRALAKARWEEGTAVRLIEMACAISSIGDWGEGPELLALDEARLRFELGFFRLHFLEGFLNVDPEPELERGLRALAEEVAAFPLALAHRDFHSDNVIAGKEGRLVLVDFQDALMAPRCYDAASLAVDPYRRRDRELDERFCSLWVARSGAQTSEFRLTALQRALKALGTFGYQVTRRKRVRYVQFVRPQARRALELLEEAPAGLAALEPHLKSAMQVE